MATLEERIKAAALREYLRDKKARPDRYRLLAKIKKIVGPKWHSPIMDEGGCWAPENLVDAELFRHAERCAAHERVRSRYSKDSNSMQAIKQFSAALRKANRPMAGLPEDFRLLFGLDQMIHHVDAYETAAGIPKRDAYAKRSAARSAKYLCESFGIPLRATRKNKKTNKEASVFCQLAAVLFGNEDADLSHYCRELLVTKELPDDMTTDDAG
jgi:hypothetical protein